MVSLEEFQRQLREREEANRRGRPPTSVDEAKHRLRMLERRRAVYGWGDDVQIRALQAWLRARGVDDREAVSD